MSLIEQAARRLEQLRKAGVEFPGDDARATMGGSSEVALPMADWERSAPDARQVHSSTTPSAMDARPQGGGEEKVARGTAIQSRKVDIDLHALAEKYIITPEAPRSRMADEYRVIKRPLIANAMGKGAAPIADGNLIMVTSALPREGKSYTAVNLAISIAAELDNTVMLVDADVARPSVLNVLGLPPAPGLLDLLTSDSTKLSDVLLRTNIEKLTLLPSGNPRQRATELLASDAMTKLLREMASRYPDRIIIFDSPPLLLTTESRVLATHMGQVVLVVQAERTSQSDVKQALATIEACPVKMVILNQARESAGGGYGYGYGYGYGDRQAD